MSTKVYITGIQTAIPGLKSGQSLLKFKASQSQNPVTEFSSKSKVRFESLKMDEENPFYPSKSDLKVMREDSIALTVIIQQLIHSKKLTEEELDQTSLFIASGSYNDYLSTELDKISMSYQSQNELEDKVAENKKRMKVIPPLLALRTLTNATQSFASQYAEMKGSGTTYGVTSVGSYYALKEGVEKIKSGEVDRAIIGASNLSGVYSYLTYQNFVSDSEDWHESTAAVCLLLESEHSVLQRKSEPIAEIGQLKQIPQTPSLLSKFNGFSSENITGMGNNILFGGAYTDKDYLSDKHTIEQKNKKAFSWYPYMGNTGAASLLLNIATACEERKIFHHKKYSCLDYDAYGRVFNVSIL